MTVGGCSGIGGGFHTRGCARSLPGCPQLPAPPPPPSQTFSPSKTSTRQRRARPRGGQVPPHQPRERRLPGALSFPPRAVARGAGGGRRGTHAHAHAHTHTHTRTHTLNTLNPPNAALQARVAVVPGAVEFLETCGFKVGALAGAKVEALFRRSALPLAVVVLRVSARRRRARHANLRAPPPARGPRSAPTPPLRPSLALKNTRRAAHTSPPLREQKEEGGEALFMPREAADAGALNAAGAEINNALTNPFFGAL
jgi:hypothetical protein